MAINPRLIPTDSLKQRPDWLRVRVPTGETYDGLKTLMRSKALHTVCEEARCPNIAECWSHGVATFMILGDTCTRSCGFCAVATGRPLALDWEEPRRVAEAVAQMGLKHVVVTMVNRDELRDGGATLFAATIRQIRRANPDCAVEVLASDFKGYRDALQILMDAKPDVFSHNVETVPRLYRRVRPQADLPALARRALLGQGDASRDAHQDRLHARPRRDTRRDRRPAARSARART